MRAFIGAILLASTAPAFAQQYGGEPTTTTTSTSTITITRTLVSDGTVSTVTSTLADTSAAASTAPPSSSSSPPSTTSSTTIYVPLSTAPSTFSSLVSSGTAPFPVSTGGYVAAPSGTAVGTGVQPNGTSPPIQSFTPGSKANHVAPLGWAAGIAGIFAIGMAIGM